MIYTKLIKKALDKKTPPAKKNNTKKQNANSILFFAGGAFLVGAFIYALNNRE